MVVPVFLSVVSVVVSGIYQQDFKTEIKKTIFVCPSVTLDAKHAHVLLDLLRVISFTPIVINPHMQCCNATM